MEEKLETVPSGEAPLSTEPSIDRDGDPAELPSWLQDRVRGRAASLVEHQDDPEYLVQKLRAEREIVSKLLGLLVRYGLTLPDDATSLPEALALIAPLRDSSAQVLVGHAAARAERKRRIVSEGSQFFKEIDQDGMAGKFKRLQEEIPITTKVEVRLKEVTYKVQRAASQKINPTVGDKCMDFWRGLACLLPTVARAAGGQKAPKLRKNVLDDISAIFRPGELTVVLGPPGSGKSALLHIIAGRLRFDKNHTVTGDVLYNGLSGDSGKFVLPKVVGMVEERDEHVATLTVQETLSFAFDSMEGARHASWIPEESRSEQQKETLKWMDEHKAKVNLVMRAMGLFNAKDTIVGGQGLRGVSGGERRRVTAAEMIVGSHDVMMMDSISTGLDSSTTFDITSTLREATRVFGKTIVVALLQPPPEVFDLFDNVCLLAGGHVIYFGPKDGALPYFGSLGYHCPPRKDIADFLVEVPTDQGAAYIKGQQVSFKAGFSARDLEANVDTSVSWKHRPPRTPEEFALRWKDSEHYKKLAEELSAPAPGTGEEYEWPPSQKRKFAGSWMYHYKLCLVKHRTLFWRDKGYMRQRIVTCLVMGLIIGTIFFQLSSNDVNAIFGVIFFSQLFLALASIVAIPQAIEYRAVVYKQTDANFYSASADTFAQVVVSGALQCVEAIIFAPIVYFMVGLSTANGGKRFFAFMAVLMTINLNLAAYFRALAALFPDFGKAQSFGGISIVFIILFCGFLVPETDIPDAWIWIFWLNPLAWSFRAAVLNEFLSPEYSGGAGTEVLTAYGFRQSTNYIWGAIVFVTVQFFMVLFLTAFLLTFVRYDVMDNKAIDGSAVETPQPVTDEESVVLDYVEKMSAANSITAGPGEANISAKEEEEMDTIRRGSAMVARQVSNSSVIVALQKSQEGVPFTPVTLSFHDIWYSVPHPSGEGDLDLLKGVSGFCKPGEMTALMGSSGAGKTTLLDVLAGRKTGGTIKGDILLNGHPKEGKTFTRVAGYVEQVDVHSPAVTVREALQFSADLRLQHDLWTKDSKRAYVENILSMLELDIIGDTIIGTEDGGGLSIEQRKRVTIGVEMAANPSLLYLDEPTSGLDARAAQVVMNAIRRVAATGRTVICTIHQPSTFLFEMFDALLLLKKGGETVYFGELGEASVHLVEYLSQIPGTAPIKPNANPATWMLETIGAGTSGRVSPQIYADYYRGSILHEENDAKLEELRGAGARTQALKFDSPFAATDQMQRSACLSRALTQYWRSSTYNFTRLSISVVVALVFASNFVNQKVVTESQLASRLGVLYMVTTFMGIVMFQQSIPFFALERPVFYREQANNMYAFSAYAFGYGIAELPYACAAILLFSIIFYFMGQFATDAAKFGWFVCMFGGFVLFMSFLGHLFSAATPSVKIAQSMGSVINSLFSIFAGFLISPAKIPAPWIWAFWINPAHYAVEGLVTTQYHDDYSPVQTLTGTIPTNLYVYEFFGGKYKFENRFYDMMALLIFIVAARVAYFLAIKKLRFEKR